MSAFDDVLGADALPPSPIFPIDQLTAGFGASEPAAQASDSGAPSAQAQGLNVPVGPQPAAQSLASASAPGMPPAMGGALTPQVNGGGLFGPNTGRVMAALGAGLASAGANWNKPGAAAFASGAGAALQGGQQWDAQQQDAKLKALHAAIAAWKTGDMAAYHQAIANLRAARATPNRPAVGLNEALAQARDAIARGAPRDAVLQRLREHGFDV
jgi:hypothetical protein